MSAGKHWLTTAFDGIAAFLPSLVAGPFLLAIGLFPELLLEPQRSLERVTRAVPGRFGDDSPRTGIGCAAFDRCSRGVARPPAR